MPEPLNQDRKLDILLKEYEAIRAEILHKLSRIFALTGLLGAAGAWVVTNADSRPIGIVAIVVVGVVYLVLSRDLCRAKGQLALTEKKICDLAHDDDLLTWERRQGRGFICGMLSSANDRPATGM